MCACGTRLFHIRHVRHILLSTLSTLRTAGMISRETAIGTIANDSDIEDPATEMAKIAKDEAEADARALKQAQAQTKITEDAPG